MDDESFSLILIFEEKYIQNICTSNDWIVRLNSILICIVIFCTNIFVKYENLHENEDFYMYLIPYNHNMKTIIYWRFRWEGQI